MHRFIFAILLMVIAVSPVAAAERILLTPSGTNGIASSTPAQKALLTKLRQSAGSTGSIPVIVGLRVPFAPEGRLDAAGKTQQRREIERASLALRSRLRESMRRDPSRVRNYSTLPFVALDVTLHELDALATDPDVISISEDRKNQPSLAQSAPLVAAPQAWSAGYTGQGQTIAIIDTGVDKTHAFLAGKVVSEACFSRGYCPGGLWASTAPGSGVPCPNRSRCKHGTHVAGIAAGRGPSYSGIAKDATLIAIQVFSRYGRTDITAYDSDVLAGLNRVQELHGSFNIAAVNMSLGRGTYYAICDSENLAMSAAIATLQSEGIATVVSSGNDGYTSALEFPACISSAVSVGSVSDADWGNCWRVPTAVDKVACYSNTASMLSLLAPGSAITSSVPGGRYETWHGTSMAAPHVAGAWAVLKQKVPEASVQQVLAALQSSGKIVADYRTFTNTPRIDVNAGLATFATLNFTRTGSGLGTITISKSSGSTTTCYTACSISAVPGTTITVTASAANGSAFDGWTGACTGSTSNCSIVLETTASLGANFTGETSLLTFAKTGTGSGKVNIATTTGTLECSSSCSLEVAPSTPVTVTATPGAGTRLAGWSGPCSGTGSCSFMMPSSEETLEASFSPVVALSYAKAGRGTGTVTFTAEGSVGTCDAACNQTFDLGTVVTLTATAGPQARFVNWTGSCRGRSTCIITMSQAKAVRAYFIGR